MLSSVSFGRAASPANIDVFGERGHYLIKAGGNLVTAIAYFVMTVVFTGLSTVTFFQLEGLESGRVDAWTNTQHYGSCFKAHLVGVVDPKEARKLLKAAPARPIYQYGLLKRITIAVDEAIFKGFLDNSERAQKLKACAAVALAIACYLDKDRLPLVLAASTIPLLGARRLGFTGTLMVAGTTGIFWTLPGASTGAMTILKGLWALGGGIVGFLKWAGEDKKPQEASQSDGTQKTTDDPKIPVGLFQKAADLFDELLKLKP